MATLDILRHADDAQPFAAGTTIIEEGRPGKLMYVVKAGSADILVGGKVVASVGPGEVFGELSLIDDRARSAAVVARTDCELVPVDERRFLFLVQQTPYFAIQVMRVLAERLRRMNEIVGR
jgi:CRP-like cAMP-binding protein